MPLKLGSTDDSDWGKEQLNFKNQEIKQQYESQLNNPVIETK